MNRPPTYLERLDERRRVWWQKPRDYRDPRTYSDFLHQIAERHVLRSRHDPEERWHCCRHWQRSLVNKWNGREFAIRHGVPVPELYWCGRRLSKLDFEALPSRCVIKPAFGHSRRGVFVLCEGVELLSGTRKGREDVLRTLGRTGDRLLNGPVLVEEFMGDGSGRARMPLDVNFHMFGREVGAVQVIKRSPVKGETRCTFCSAAWEPFAEPLNRYLPELDPVSAPTQLPELLKAARRLGQACETYIRVDFRVTGDRFAFGEFATTPPMGWTPFGDAHFGRLWQETFPAAI
ncbi:MAG: hypothetical protein JSV95_01065 [Gemmatimonadota bacterium]|nr:MAG: hypothetical protein JSV95_01065 [Gemmatimonadota bacterium]